MTAVLSGATAPALSTHFHPLESDNVECPPRKAAVIFGVENFSSSLFFQESFGTERDQTMKEC